MKTDPVISQVNNSPYISVIIPTRNRAELLWRALRGIQKQTFQSYEVIVVDDGSDESVRGTYTEWQQTLGPRFSFVHLGSSGQQGLGPSVARNHGIALSSGDILAFCDDDDFWCADSHLETMAKTFSVHPKVDMYIANQIAMSVSGIRRNSWLPQLDRLVASRTRFDENGYLLSVEDLCKSGGFAHLNILSLRRTKSNQIHGFWEKVSYEEDRDFFWRAVDCCTDIFFNPKVIAQHNIPDPDKRKNQSTKHSMVERWMLSVLVCQHISTSVNNSSISALVGQYEGDLLRHLSRYFAGNRRHALGLQFARRALAARFSFKWLGYVGWLMFGRLLGKQES